MVLNLQLETLLVTFGNEHLCLRSLLDRDFKTGCFIGDVQITLWENDALREALPKLLSIPQS